MDFNHESDKKIIKDLERNVENLEHIRKIAMAMAPDPTVWEYQGECIDTKSMNARCTCVHPIRYIFYIINTQNKSKLPIGSTCIRSTVPYLTESGAESLAKDLEIAREKLIKEIQRKAAEEQKRKREHEQNEKIVEMERDLQVFIEVMQNYKRQSYRDCKYIPYCLYKNNYSMPKACKKPGFTIRRMINTYREWVYSWYYASKSDRDGVEKSGYPIPMCPIPKNAELFDILMNIQEKMKD